MATTLKINRQHETIKVDDEDGSALYEWKVPTDDDSLNRTLNMVGNAMIRAKDLSDEQAKATTPEEAKEATDSLVKLQKRVISAIIGADGYQDVLCYIGDGEPCDPAKNIVNIGDVFGALCVWLYEHCTSKQLRDAGIYFDGEKKNAQWRPDNRASRRAKPKKRK